MATAFSAKQIIDSSYEDLSKTLSDLFREEKTEEEEFFFPCQPRESFAARKDRAIREIDILRSLIERLEVT